MEINLEKVVREIDKKYKAIEKKLATKGFIVSKNNISNNISFNIHHYYSLVFFDEFSATNKYNDFINLSVLGRLFFNFCLIQDKIIDTNNYDYNLLLSQNILFNKAIDIMHTEFKLNTQLWKYFEVLFDEYISALLLEKKRHYRNFVEYSQKELEIIGAGKSALAKIIVAALTTDEAKLNKIFRSNDYFYIAYQLYDDLQDWKEDLKHKNYSYLLTNVLNDERLSKNIINDAYINYEKIGKVLYFAGYAEKNLQLAEEYFQKSLTCLGNLKCLSWRKIVSDHLIKANELKNDLNKIKEEILSGKGNKKNDRFNNAKTKNISELSKRSLLNSLQSGINYVKTQQKNDGYWEDIKLDVGNSTEWVTGYVGYALIETIENIGKHQKNELEFLDKAKNWLLKKVHKNGGWGFNSVSGVDVDSTSNCVLFLKKIGGIKSINIDEIKNIYFENLNEKGIGTYSIKEIKREKKNNNVNFALPLSGYAGWCSSDTQISAITIISIIELGLFNEKNIIIRGALDFIRQTQSSEGYWNSYWSNGKLLGTYYCVEALSLLGVDGNRISKALEWLSKQQTKEGGWNNGVEEQITSYDTSLALISLMVQFGKYKTQIKKGIEWLVKNQLNDGSWEAFPFMTIPAPWDETQINTPKILKAVADDNRIFTTATVLKSLSKFYKLTY